MTDRTAPCRPCCGAQEPDWNASHATENWLGENERLRAALTRIEKWFGEFPETGKFWDNADGSISDRPMNYGAYYGSNGERDYMRAIARKALSCQGDK